MQPSDVEIVTRNSALEDSVDHIVHFVTSSTPKPFSFIFVDPTGWTGFALETIRPLLKLAPGEVLINFMTEHVRRFIESPDERTQRSFVELFGSADFRERLARIPANERRDAVVFEYAQTVANAGDGAEPNDQTPVHAESFPYSTAIYGGNQH